MAHTSLEMAIKLGRFGTLFQQQLQFCAAATIRHAYAALTLPQRLTSPAVTSRNGWVWVPLRWARFAYDELKREQRVTQMPAGGSPSLPCYRMGSSDRPGYPSAATDPQRPARAIVFSAEERGGVCKRREPSLRRGWDRAAPQSRRRSFQGHGAYRAHRFGCRSAPATLITARNGGRRRSNRPVEPRMRSCWLCCVTPGALVLPRVSPSVAWRCSSSRCGEAALAARVPIRPR